MDSSELQRLFVFDANICIGCHGCAAACKNGNTTDSDTIWRKVHKIPPVDGSSSTSYISMSCNHCENPPCLQACPTKSYKKREDDGVVIHTPSTCMGCKYCQMACPYGAIKWNSRTKTVNKCHFCYEKLDNNQEPACVRTCFTGALTQQLVKKHDIDATLNQEIEGVTYLEKVNPSIRFILKDQQEKPRRKKQFPPIIPVAQEDENG